MKDENHGSSATSRLLYQDALTKDIISRVLSEGTLDKNPRPQWIDDIINGCEQRTPAHTLSINHVMTTYDLSKGQIPLITLRPIATGSAVKEILWIYQDQSNSLDILENKYNIHWWNEWDIGDRTIGIRYGETVRRHNLMNKLLDGLKNDPDGRRHIISMWQEEDFEKDTKGLKPCAYQTTWNVRHEDGSHEGIPAGDYLDMCLFQRSSDFITAGCINQTQYAMFLAMVAQATGYIAGRFTWYVANLQIYDRHISAAKELLRRESVKCSPRIWINPEIHDWYDFTPDDVRIEGYPREEIKEQNPQIKLQVAV